MRCRQAGLGPLVEDGGEEIFLALHQTAEIGREFRCPRCRILQSAGRNRIHIALIPHVRGGSGN
jgi:hypothetical protein